MIKKGLFGEALHHSTFTPSNSIMKNIPQFFSGPSFAMTFMKLEITRKTTSKDDKYVQSHRHYITRR